MATTAPFPITASAGAVPISPLGPVKVCVTVDDMLLLRGWRHAPGHDAVSTARAFARALARHGVKGVYQFSNTAQLEDDAGLYKAFDVWAEAGHYFGNHTHHHPSLNMMAVESYVEEIETAERYLERYLKASPCRCFRFCADNWGDTACKCGAILNELDRMTYRPIPVTIGFHDANWSAAYRRVLMRGTKDEAARLRDAYVDTAVHELRLFAANARAVFGRDPAHIWLIHGTSIAADSLGLILDRFAEAGVQFIDLDEAMADPMNSNIPPRVSPEFIFQIEKWAMALDVPVGFPMPAALQAIEELHPTPGEMAADTFAAMHKGIIAHSKVAAQA